jgi:hypothetical protein
MPDSALPAQAMAVVVARRVGIAADRPDDIIHM